MNIEQARFNMVEQQIRTWEVLDQAVLDLLYVVRREEFVPARIGCSHFRISRSRSRNAGPGQKMMQPKVEARILQEVAPKCRPVLEVGTGSGYMAALLAHRARHVHSVEILPELKRSAKRTCGARASRTSPSRAVTRRAAGRSSRPMTSSC